MPVERLSEHGGVVITGAAQDGLRAITLREALEIHIKFNGKFRLTRVATPARLREMATEFTGKTYTRSMKGLKQALADLNRLIDDKNLDEIGQVARVNKLVGGVAADLQEDR